MRGEIKLEILDFTMPPFARMQWASGKIKDKYEPLFNKARNVYYRTELESVIHGLRNTTTASINPNDLDTVQQNFARNGLIYLPLRRVGQYEGFSSYHPPAEDGKPWHYYGVVSNSIDEANEFANADDTGDHKTIGRLLGYPKCCIDTFFHNWSKGYTDQVWQQAQQEGPENIRSSDDNCIRIKNVHWQSNTILKYFSMGPLFHTKCSINCKSSSEMAERIIDLANKLQLEGLKELEMFLRMPMEWDASKGIAFIRTPLFKAEINSVTCVKPFKVQLEGTYFPDDSPKSNNFPWSEAWTTQARNGNKLTYAERGASE